MLDAARRRLAGAPTERLGVVAPARRVLGFTRAPRIVPAGRAWHLGALLLTDDGLLATGDILRARQEVRRGFTAESQRDRAARAAAARRGGFAEGETVHVDWTVLDVDAVAAGGRSGPLAMSSGVPRIRWSRTGAYAPLEAYLDERIALLLDPPGGAA